MSNISGDCGLIEINMNRVFLCIFVTSFLFHWSTSEQDWWENAQFYQIYPRSFKDSNGDGIGDLKGITENLDHLKDIGITATWLSPIFKSPMADFGYDISDFYAIQPEYGTMGDFDNLLKRAKELGIKIILDFVPNHSSDEHEWFKKSVNREKGYEDFYVWHNGVQDPKNSSNRLPPSNWLQAFRGSAWEWNSRRQQFYLHQFAVKQPDLNYRNPVVVEEMKNVLRFWLEKGVSGFRIDAVPWLFEIQADINGNYLNEPKSNYTDDPDNSAYLDHIYTQDQPETIDMVYQWRKVLDDFKRDHGGDTRILMTEAWSPINIVAQYYGNSTTNGSQIPFNFKLITDTNGQSSAFDIVNAFDTWMGNMPKGRVPNWVIGNHDKRRVGSRYGTERIDTMNMIVKILPGVSITYNGEEIGMVDLHISWNDTKDPAACNSNPAIYEQFSRDPARTPLQWDNTKNAGFSNGNHTWLPVNPNYMEINVKAQKNATKSHLKVYKELVRLRHSNILKLGSLKYKAFNANLVVIERTYRNNTIVLVANIGHLDEILNINSFLTIPQDFLQIEIASVLSNRVVGHYVGTKGFVLHPYESLVLSSQLSETFTDFF